MAWDGEEDEVVEQQQPQAQPAPQLDNVLATMADQQRQFQQTVLQQGQQTQQALNAIGQGLVGALQLRPQQYEDPNDPAVIEHRNRRAEQEQIAQQVVGPQVSSALQTYYRNQRQTMRRLALLDSDLGPILRKYGAEVDAMLDQQPEALQAAPNAYEVACGAVKTLHFDELVEERIAARTRRPEGEDDGEEEEVEEGQRLLTPARVAQQPIEKARPTQAAPLSPRSPAAPARTKGRKVAPLDSEERKWAQRFNQSDDEYDTYSNNLTQDFLGLRDPKTGRIREYV